MSGSTTRTVLVSLGVLFSGDLAAQVVHAADTAGVERPTEAQAAATPSESSNFREDLDAALEDASQQRKGVAIYFRAAWSPWAIAMERQVLPNPRVMEALDGLIRVLVDVGRSPADAERFGVVDFPTMVLLSPDGAELGRVHGYAGVDLLRDRITTILTAAPPGPPPTLAEVEKRGVEALYQSIGDLRLRGDLLGAAEAATRIVELDTDNSSGHTDNALAFLGLLESRMGNWDRAHKIYSRMADLYPTTELRPHLLLSLANCSAMLGLRREATSAYETFLKEYPRHTDAAYARAEVQRLKRLSTQGLGR
jgi:tetratricopeptide (TPR) repeat protein